MSVEQDDLEFNPFYLALQNQFCAKFAYAQDHCYLVCIPQTASMVGVTITAKFVETHILKPSPLFQDNYISTDRLGSKTVEVEGNEIHLLEGFENESNVKIVSEELCYNKKYKPYKMLIIERPLEGEVKGRRGSAGLSDEFLKPRTTFVENVKFLNLFPECRFQLLNLDKSIQQFNHNYLMVKGYLSAAAQKLKKIWQDNLEAIIAANNYVKLQADSRLEEVIAIATESYLIGGVHTKVFKAVCEECQSQDAVLTTKSEQLQGITGKQLGVNSQLDCPLPTSVVELARLDGIICPHEKIICLKTTLDNITEEVTLHTRDNLAPGDSPPCLTSDDLIPLLVLVISQAKCHHLAANLMYLESFRWASSKNDNLGYSLVTFKAAIEYMLREDFSPFTSSENKVKKEMSIQELMAASKLTSDESSSGTETAFSNNEFDGVTQSLQREFNNISKMMQESLNIQRESRHQSGSQKTRNKGSHKTGHHQTVPVVVSKSDPKASKSSKLGDFLLALQNDVLDSTYGKQE